MPFTSSAKLPGDRLQNAGPGEAVEVWIYSAFQKDNWVAHKPGDFTHADYPGTAIQIGKDIFEILTVEETAEPGYAVRYGLKKWDPQFAVRQIFPFTPETQARLSADYLEEKHKQDLRARILWLFPLAGLAPDPVQREWEKKTALNMTVVSATSAVTTVIVFLILTSIFGRSPGSKALLYFMEYLGIESFVRLLWIVFTRKPHGTLVLTLPYMLWEAVAQPEKHAEKKETWLKFTYEGDQVIRRPGSGHLVISSMLFDDILIGPHPILFEGTVYKPLHWREEGKGLVRRLVYEFEKTDLDPTKGRYREYTQPRTPERQKVVEALTHSRDRTQIFALFWGTYPRREQLRLEVKYRFAAAKFTAVTALFLLALAALYIWVSVVMHASIIAIAGPVYLVFESLYRLYQSKVFGVPAGSAVGYLFRLFLRPPQ